jgi:hypothetical protein
MGRGDFDVAKFGAEPGRFGGVPVREVGGIRTGSYLQSSSSIQPVRAPVFPFSNGGERGMAATEIRASRKRLLSAYVPVELYERVARIAAENERPIAGELRLAVRRHLADQPVSARASSTKAAVLKAADGTQRGVLTQPQYQALKAVNQLPAGTLTADGHYVISPGY